MFLNFLLFLFLLLQSFLIQSFSLSLWDFEFQPELLGFSARCRLLMLHPRQLLLLQHSPQVNCNGNTSMTHTTTGSLMTKPCDSPPPAGIITPPHFLTFLQEIWRSPQETVLISTGTYLFRKRYWSGCEAIGWCFLNRAEANRIVRRAPQRGTGDVRLFRMTVGFKWVQVVVW